MKMLTTLIVSVCNERLTVERSNVWSDRVHQGKLLVIHVAVTCCKKISSSLASGKRRQGEKKSSSIYQTLTTQPLAGSKMNQTFFCLEPLGEERLGLLRALGVEDRYITSSSLIWDQDGKRYFGKALANAIINLKIAVTSMIATVQRLENQINSGQFTQENPQLSRKIDNAAQLLMIRLYLFHTLTTCYGPTEKESGPDLCLPYLEELERAEVLKATEIFLELVNPGSSSDGQELHDLVEKHAEEHGGWERLAYKYLERSKNLGRCLIKFLLADSKLRHRIRLNLRMIRGQSPRCETGPPRHRVTGLEEMPRVMRSVARPHRLPQTPSRLAREQRPRRQLPRHKDLHQHYAS